MDGKLDGLGDLPPRGRSLAPAGWASIPKPVPASWVVVIAVLLFGVSGGMLWPLHYNYEGLSGSVVTKLHPTSYLIVAIFGWIALKSGNPVAYTVRGAWLRPGACLLVIAMATLFLHIVSHAAPGMAGAIDTFLPPALLVVLMADVDERTMQMVETAVHVLMTVNAVMALVEFVIRMRFFPYRFDGAVFPFDTRSSALQGHPLVNAAVTSWYCLALLNAGRGLGPALRVGLFGLQCAALVTFGGRTAMVVTIALAGFYLAGMAHTALRAGRVPILGAAVALLLVALVPVVVAVLAAGGFFDALLGRFVADGGSANARVEMFALFNGVPFRDLLVGPDTGLIDDLRRVAGLEWGIENPIIKSLLYQGILITVLMTVAITAFLVEVSRHCRRGVWLPMLSFVLLLQTSESIAGKTTHVSKFVLAMLCLYRLPPNRISLAARPVPARR